MNTETETLSILAPSSDPHTYAAICLEQEQPLTATQRQPLTREEKQMLKDRELIIEQGINSYYEIGRALRFIKLGKLYREKYDTFEEYCRQRWGFGRHRGYQYINSSIGAEEMLTAGQQPLENERQQRLLMKLPDANARARAMARANEQASGNKVTTKLLAEVVNQELGHSANNVIEAEVVEDVTEKSGSTDVTVGDNGSIAPEASRPMVVIALSEEKETNEQAINRLFGSIREFAESKGWQPTFQDMLNELEQRVHQLMPATEQAVERKP